MYSLILIGIIVTLFHVQFSLSIPVSVERVKKGDIAKPKQFPWQTSIISYYLNKYNNHSISNNNTNYNKNLRENYCSGALISPEWVLTAAHCVDGSDLMVLGFDSLDWNKPQIKSKVEKFIVHPGYRPQTYHNNIAVVKLIEPLKFSDSVSAIQLPSRAHSDVSFDGVKSIIAGWDVISDDNNQTEIVEVSKNQLEWIELIVMSNSWCSRFYGSIIKDSTICARSTSSETICGSDFGAPLVMKNSRMIIGIASFTRGCDAYEEPIAFTRITSYLDWISETTGIVIE